MTFVGEADAVDGDAFDLESMAGCFDGVVPPVIATSSAGGHPNVTHISQLYLIDRHHVAVSNQFFSKTSANLAENPLATVQVTDSRSFDTFRFDLCFERTETAGAVFDELRACIEAVGALMHMEDVFALRGADVYRLLGWRLVARGDGRP